MHPDPAFRIEPADCARIAAELAFAHVFVASPSGIAVIHAPVTLVDGRHLHFHVSRRNRALPLLDGARAIASFAGENGYVSPDWYESAGQVPTWNYAAVEAEGSLSPLSREALVAQIDALGAEHEARLAPKPAWTRDKMPDGSFDRMLGGIAGFALTVEAWRGTAKLSQNKPARDVAGVVAGLRGTGLEALAARVEAANAGR
jgi:transcriptional regulator